MAATRSIKIILISQPTIEGAGVHLKRAFGYAQLPHFDPFLMLDDFHTDDPAQYLPGFPWHPHRGIETITYLLEGLVEHGDSMGNRGVISAGDVQWMTAGSGIIHQEMPKESPTGSMWGFQLWANLPAREKMMAPRYQDVKAAQIPEVTLEGGAVLKVIAGTVSGVQGPVRDIIIEPEMLDIRLPAASLFHHPLPAGHTAFAYVLAGEGDFGALSTANAPAADSCGSRETSSRPVCTPETVVLFGHEGDAVQVSTTGQPVHFLLVAGKPLAEPIAWRGPIVMNSQEELQVAFQEYEAGTFIK